MRGRTKVWLGGLVAVIVIVVAVVAASGGGSTSKSSSAKTSMTFARAFDVISLNPPSSGGDNGSFWDMPQIFDQLVEYQPGSVEPQPGLAKTWSQSSDGLTWTFHLRAARFSNGQPVTATDVAFSLSNFINPKIDTGFGFLSEAFKSADATSPTTVVVHMNHRDDATLAALAVPVASITPQSVVKGESAAQFGLVPVGSGPYMVKQDVHGKVLELIKNPYYWRPGLPRLDAIHVTYVADDNTRILQVESGQANVAEGIPFDQIKQVNSQANVKVIVSPIEALDAIWPNHAYAPFRDLKVRQALIYALDRNAINKSAYGGTAEVANSMLAKVKYWDPSVSPYPYNLALAKQLMAKSKYPHGFSVNLLVPAGDSLHNNVAVIAKAQWAKIGVSVTISPVDSGALFTQFSAGKYQMAIPAPLVTSDVLVPDELGLAWLAPIKGQPASSGFYTDYNNPALGKLVFAANQTPNEATRAKLWREIQAKGMADAPWIPVVFVPSRMAVRTNVSGFEVLRSGWPTLDTTSLK